MIYINLEQFIRDLGMKPPKKDSGGGCLRIFGLVFLLLIIFVLFAISIAGGSVFRGDNPAAIGLVIFFGGGLLMLSGYNMFLKGRKKEQTLKIFNELGDTRRPIIYLRSFADDDPGLTIGRYLKMMIVPFYFNKVLFPHEEALSKALRQFGPVLAIGQPGKNLPDVGAARLYTDPQGDKWQRDVIQMLEACQLIVLRAGNTNGLQWEIRKVFSQMPPEKVLLYVDLSKKKYKKFVENFHQWTGIQLPQTDSIKFYNPFFIYFYEGFQYSISPIKTPLTRQRTYQANTSPFLYGLKPLFEQKSVVWQKPRLNWLMCFMYFIIGLFVLMLVLALLMSL